MAPALPGLFYSTNISLQATLPGGIDKLWTVTRAATPLPRALRYIIAYVTHESEPYNRQLLQSPSIFDRAMFKDW